MTNINQNGINCTQNVNINNFRSLPHFSNNMPQNSNNFNYNNCNDAPIANNAVSTFAANGVFDNFDSNSRSTISHSNIIGNFEFQNDSNFNNSNINNNNNNNFDNERNSRAINTINIANVGICKDAEELTLGGTESLNMFFNNAPTCPSIITTNLQPLQNQTPMNGMNSNNNINCNRNELNNRNCNQTNSNDINANASKMHLWHGNM